jgi:phosphoribosylformylglycinamidine synthase PurS subunit
VTSPEGPPRPEVLKARVHITLKPGVLDPQGNAIGNALKSLGFEGVGEVRQGKVIEIDLAESDRGVASRAVEAMCTRLLTNPVIENYSIEFE